MGSGEKTIAVTADPVGHPVGTKYYPSSGEVAILNYANERAIVATMRYNARGELEIEIEVEEGEKVILWAGTIATGDEGQIAIKATRAYWSGDLWDEIAPSLGIEGDDEIETPAGKQARDLLTEPIYHETEMAAFEQATRWARRHRRGYVVLHLPAHGYTVEVDSGQRYAGLAGFRLVGRVDREHPAGLKNHAPIPEEIITDAEARELAELLSAEVFKRPVTVGTQRADPPSPDPLAAFRHLPEGAPIHDRASGRLIGHLERVTGDTVQLRSVITGHSVYSSGLAIVPEGAPH